MTGAGCGIPAPNLVFDGDSLTEGYGLTIPPDAKYPDQVVAPLGYAVDQLWNVAVGGQTAANRTSAAPTVVDPKYKTNGAPQIVIFWAGTNDLYFGTSAATTYARIVAYATARKAAGWRVVLLTILPRSNIGTPAGFEVARQSVNDSLLTDFSTATGEAGIWTGAAYADYLVHVGGDSTIGDAGDENNATYYADTIHPTAAGHAIMASIIIAALFP